MFITISYIAVTIFIASIFIYRIKKQTFTSFLTEEIGLLVSSLLLSLVVEVSIVIKVIIVSSLLAIFIYGSIKKDTTS